MSDILDLIDGAINDCQTSEDAMRWSPEPIEEQRTVYLAEIAWLFDIPELLDWQQDLVHWRIIMRYTPIPRPTFTGWTS